MQKPKTKTFFLIRWFQALFPEKEVKPAARPRYKKSKFVSEAAQNGRVYQLVLENNKDLDRVHRESIAALKLSPYDRKLMEAVRVNRRYVSASLNIMNVMKGEKPQHFPQGGHEAMRVALLMTEMWKDFLIKAGQIEEVDVEDATIELGETIYVIA